MTPADQNRALEKVVARWESGSGSIISQHEIDALIASWRALKAARPYVLAAAFDAALAAEPASGETRKPVICIGEPIIAMLRNREEVELSNAILLPASDLSAPPPASGEATHVSMEELRQDKPSYTGPGLDYIRPSPPAQGEENHLMFTREQFEAALCQRANEAFEEAAKLVKAHGDRCISPQSLNDWYEARLDEIADAIRARITPKGQT